MNNWLLFLFLLLIPTQLGKYFWFEWSLVNGIRSDYLSPTLYLTDIIWIGWVVSIIFNFRFLILKRLINYQFDKRLFGKYCFVLIGGAFIVSNVWLAGNQWVAGYRWLRMGQWIISLILLRKKADIIRPYMRMIIPVWVVGESLLAVAQVARNGSLQGLFYWLGERKFDYMTIGTALISWFDELRVRAYGTFSHPNSLAGFLLAAIVVWEKVLKQNPLVLPPIGEAGRTTFPLTRDDLVKWIIKIVGVVGIILTGSRTVWMAGGIVTGIKLLEKLKGGYKARPYILTIIGLMIIGTMIMNSDGWDKESWGKRMELNRAAIEMIRDNPFFGVGAGNFVIELAKYKDGGIMWLQPVHNIVLLGMSEVGLTGMVMIIGLIVGLVIKKGNQKGSPLQIIMDNRIILVVVMITGMMDHYWLTLPQNMWLLAVIAAII